EEMPKMGGLQKYLPTTYRTMWVGWLAICGIIPFAGFFSKDEILWKTFSTHVFGGSKILWLAGFVTAGITAFYMTRLMALTFWGEERFRHAHHEDGHHGEHHGPVEPHESPRSMTLPLIVLAGGSLVAGLFGIPHALSGSLNLNRFEHWLEPVIADVRRESPGAAAHSLQAAGSPVETRSEASPASETAEPVDPMEYVLIL